MFSLWLLYLLRRVSNGAVDGRRLLVTKLNEVHSTIAKSRKKRKTVANSLALPEPWSQALLKYFGCLRKNFFPFLQIAHEGCRSSDLNLMRLLPHRLLRMLRWVEKIQQLNSVIRVFLQEQLKTLTGTFISEEHMLNYQSECIFCFSYLS